METSSKAPHTRDVPGGISLYTSIRGAFCEGVDYPAEASHGCVWGGASASMGRLVGSSAFYALDAGTPRLAALPRLSALVSQWRRDCYYSMAAAEWLPPSVRRGSATGPAPPASYKAPFGRPLSSPATRGAARRTRPLVVEEESGAAARCFVEGWGARWSPLGPSSCAYTGSSAELPERQDEDCRCGPISDSEIVELLVSELELMLELPETVSGGVMGLVGDSEKL